MGWSSYTPLRHRPLGTGGALRQAAGYISTDNFLVMNGDSYSDADLTWPGSKAREEWRRRHGGRNT